MICYRRAELDDFERIVELQNNNLLSARQDDLTGGFLATAYTLEQFKQMNAEMAVVVCESDKQICGYLGSCNIEFFKQFPIAGAMMQRLSTAKYRGKKLDLSRLLFTNPVCVDASFRGQGIYLGLCKAIFPYLPKQHDLAVTLVPVENKRSFIATSRFGFEVIVEFDVNGKVFYGMIISLPEFSRQFMLSA